MPGRIVLTAADLAPGQVLATPDGRTSTITSVARTSDGTVRIQVALEAGTPFAYLLSPGTAVEIC